MNNYAEFDSTPIHPIKLVQAYGYPFLVPDTVKYAAIDADGEIVLFKETPRLSDDKLIWLDNMFLRLGTQIRLQGTITINGVTESIADFYTHSVVEVENLDLMSFNLYYQNLLLKGVISG